MANTYPFITKAQVIAQLQDPEFVVDCMRIMQHRHSARISSTEVHGGWMASHAKVATELAARVACAEPSNSDVGKARKLLQRYVKQLTSHFRAEQIRANPELAELARLFGVFATVAPAPVVLTSVVESVQVEVAESPEAFEDEVSAPIDDDEGDVETADDQDELTAGAVSMTLRVEPDLRSEELAARISISTAMLAPTLRLMTETGKLLKSGNGRGTRYRLPD